jgi:hypothetical protein
MPMPIKHLSPLDKTATDFVMQIVDYLSNNDSDQLTLSIPYLDNGVETIALISDPLNWLQQVIEANLDEFDLDGYWSSVWSDGYNDLRVDNWDDSIAVTVVPWNFLEQEHLPEDTWKLFSIDSKYHSQFENLEE